MAPSHLAAALALGLLASRWRRFTRRDWALALGFAVAIDLDHLLQLPTYVTTNGFAALRPAAMLHWGAAWQGVMHTPWALALIVPACLAWRTWIPLGFWGLHMAQDFVVATRYVRFGSPLELAVLGGLVLLVGALLWDDHRRHGAGTPFGRHAARALGLARPEA